VTPTSSKGIRAFHAYLAYIHGAPTVDEASVGDADNDFEWVVAERLRDEGYECVTQVGVNNFRFDIGVRHPDHEGTFIAGIECDGAPYHSGFTVRDRDRIRQQVLEGLNWRIYRVWSVDWYQNPDQEIAKLTEWLANIREGLAAQRSEVLLPHSERAEKAEKDDRPVSSHPNPKDETQSEGASAKAVDTIKEGNAEPIGRAMRPLGDFDWYEVIRGQRYSVWIHGSFCRRSFCLIPGIGCTASLWQPSAGAAIRIRRLDRRGGCFLKIQRSLCGGSVGSFKRGVISSISHHDLSGSAFLSAGGSGQHFLTEPSGPRRCASVEGSS
jgi:very-short-patch-repair endonuclease